MNEAGQYRCNELQQRSETAAELQRRLIHMQLMSILCHCSAEIDQSTLLYFSVHDMFLGDGDYILLLFADLSGPTTDQATGMDPFSRVYTYSLIQEEVQAALTGHVSFYSSELDGRLVVLIIYHYGLLPAHRAGLIEQIGVHCAEISASCKEKYDLNVIAYISDVMDQIPMVASTYHKMLSIVTLHRYIGKQFSAPVFRLFRPEIGGPSPFSFPMDEHARSIAVAIIVQSNYHELLDKVLNEFANMPLQSIDELKGRFGDLFEAICAELKTRGVRLNIEKLRQEHMSLIMDETDWAKPVQWLHEFTDQIAATSRSDKQTLLKQTLHHAQEYIADQLFDPGLSAKNVAEAVGIGVPALSVMFRQQLKTTPSKYIRDLRLKHAAELLRTTKRSIQDICASCGFGSLETFHRVFRAEFGITPGTLRRLSLASQAEQNEITPNDPD